MGVTLNSYISFNGNAKEAIEFYKSIFGGEAFIDTFGKYADKMPVQDADKDKVMHAFLKGDNGIELMLSDAPVGMPLSEGSALSLTLSGDDEALLKEYWDMLSASGNVTVPLSESPWGDTFGMLTDKFGVNWMVDIRPTQQ